MPSAFIIFLLFFMVVMFCFAGAPVFHDPDTAWHLAAGELIRTTHTIPMRDSWSFTAGNETWYNLSWLFDYGLSLLFSKAGFSAVYALTIVVFAGSIALMAQHCLKRGATPAALLVLIIPVVLVVFSASLARPNMCSVLLAVLFYRILVRFRETQARLSIAILPCLMVLWVNLHGGFLLAFPLIGFFLLEGFIPVAPLIIRRFYRGWCTLNGRTPAKHHGKAGENIKARHSYFLKLLVIVLLCLLGSLLNPYGMEVYYGAYKSLSADFSKALTEWKPVEIGHNPPVTLLLLLVLCFGNGMDTRIALADRVMAVCMVLLGLSSNRHTAVSALLLMPFLALRITTVLYESPLAAMITRMDTAITRDMQKKDVKVLSFVMLGIALILLYLPYPRDEFLKEPVGFRTAKFPFKEAEYIAEHYPRVHFFNHYNIGGYLVYLWQGKVKVFVDGRANSLYSNELLADYMEFSENHGFGQMADIIAIQYQLGGLIIPNDDRDFWVWNSNPAWQAVYRGEVATVYVKKTISVVPCLKAK